jgi:phosphoribosylformimino-5-aminoimidazole carboxamide ribotide isomerase
VRDDKIAISGWREQSPLELVPFLEDYQSRGVRYVICTDIAKDGLLEGAAIDLYRRLRERFPDFRLIASGGIASVGELEALREIGCFGAIIGKALYEGKIALKDLRPFEEAAID